MATPRMKAPIVAEEATLANSRRFRWPKKLGKTVLSNVDGAVALQPTMGTGVPTSTPAPAALLVPASKSMVIFC